MGYSTPEHGIAADSATASGYDELVCRFIRTALSVPQDQLSDVGSWHAHVPFAYALMSILRPRLTVELGVHKGDSYLTLCRSLVDHGIEGRIAGVDTWQGDSHAGIYNESAVLGDLRSRHDPHFTHISTLLQKTFDEALNDIADGTVDLLHIDGLHTYEAVRHDFEAWRPKLSERAVVLYHDTTVHEGDFGVWKLWSEISSLGPSHEFEFGNGLGVLAPGTEVSEEFRSLLAALKSYPVVGGMLLHDFLRLVGNGLADSRRVAAVSREKIQVFDEWMDERKRATAEIERLNTEINGQREHAGTIIAGLRDETARVHNEWMEERSRAIHEIERLNAEIDLIQEERMAGGAVTPSNPAEIVLDGQRLLGESSVSALAFQGQNDEVGKTIARADVNRPSSDVAARITQRRRKSAEVDDMLARQELERLRAEMTAERQQSAEVLSNMNNELTSLRASIATHEQALQELLAAHRSGMAIRFPPNRRELKSSLKTAIVKAQRASQPVLQTAGRATIALLPMGPEGKVRFKNKLLDIFGGVFGIQRGYIEPSSYVSVANVAFAVPGERYRNLALSARGRPKILPERSVSIIIPVYNQIEYTLACLDSIKANTEEIEHEIIVVDDCSSDQTAAILSSREDITYICNGKNLGFIGSCNAGAARASKNYVCFLNNDTKVLPNWLSALVNTFELHEHVGLAGSKLIFPDGRLQEAGGLIWSDGSGWNWGRLQDPANPRFNYARNADYCSGASILVPRALFTALDGFDCLYAPAYCEDSDLAFKIRSLGLATIYQPLSMVVHYEGVTSGTDLKAGHKKHQVVNSEKLAKRWAPILKHQGAPGVDPDIAADRGVLGRILVLDQITPEPDRDAGSITALEMIRSMRDLGYKITFAPCSNFTWLPPYSEMLGSLGVESVVLPWCESMTAHLERFGASYDAVVIYRPQTWSDYIGLVRKHAPRARVVYHASDLHFLRNERFMQLSEPVAAKASLEKLELAKQAELELISAADLCIVHSIAEKSLLESYYPSIRVVCFNWLYEPRGNGPDFNERQGLIFMGGYRHPPNTDAAHYFIDDIYPLLEGRLPATCKFIAAGSFPPPELESRSTERIVVPGYVEDIEPLMFGARVMVVPLRYGAGTKGKIVASLAHGLPVVTTSVGAEGMGLVHEEHVLIADDEAAFADAVSRLYHDGPLWLRLRQAGLDYVQRTTSRHAGIRIMADVLNKIGLQTLPVDDNDGQPETQFGSRYTLADPSRLIYAAEIVLGRNSCDTIVVPDGLVERVPKDAGRRIVGLGMLHDINDLALTNLVIVADSTDYQSIRAISQYCRSKLPVTA
ncbi:MAG: glycosyltransferase, partial [Hyphomicrobium sp.]